MLELLTLAAVLLAFCWVVALTPEAALAACWLKHSRGKSWRAPRCTCPRCAAWMAWCDARERQKGARR